MLKRTEQNLAKAKQDLKKMKDEKRRWRARMMISLVMTSSRKQIIITTTATKE